MLIGQEQECALTRDIVDLVDREVDLMTRGVKSAKLEGLRKRICTLLLQYIKTPAFNPEVAKLLKVSDHPSSSHVFGTISNMISYVKLKICPRFPRILPS